MIDMMINGRLGNQLFMYAMARSAQLESGSDKIFFNTYRLEEEHGYDYSISHYQLADSVCYYSRRYRTLGNGTMGTWWKNYLFMKYIKDTINMSAVDVAAYEDKYESFFQKNGLFICKDRYKPMNLKNRKYILLYGYFQSEKYFRKYKDIILRELTPKTPLLKKNELIYKNICESESVCVSVRLGNDFRKNDILNVCQIQYFLGAMDYLRTQLKNPKFYIFSDKTELLEQYFGKSADVIFENGNDPDYEKLRIMSACKHFVISNSSFSWWAQYMGTYKNKIVIAPNRWYNGVHPCDIYMDSWVLFDPETGKMV